MQTGAQRIETALAQLLADGAEAHAVANTSHSIWLGVAAALSPIVGHGGVTALYRRTLYVSQAQHPALRGLHDAVHGATADFTPLREVLRRQSGADAAFLSSSIFSNFFALLSTLIGPSLTERLLASVLDTPSTDRAEQEPTP